MKKIFFLLLTLTLISTTACFAQSKPREVNWENHTYIQIIDDKNKELTQQGDLSGDGVNETIISFATQLPTSDIVRTFTQIFEKDPTTGKEVLVKTFAGNITPGSLRLSDVNLDNVPELIIFTKAGTRYTSIQIIQYDYYAGDYNMIFEDGSVTKLVFFDGRLTSEGIQPSMIKIGRTNWSVPGAWNFTDEPLWEVYEWNTDSSMYIYSEDKSNVEWVGEKQDMDRTLTFYNSSRKSSSQQLKSYGKRLFGTRMQDLLSNY